MANDGSIIRASNIGLPDGTMQIAVSDLITAVGGGSAGPTAVNNVAALRATDWSKVTVVQTMGYWAALDGGHGAYCKRVGDTTSADNGGTILIAADGVTRIGLVQDGCTNLRQWGCRGDAVADDTARVQAAVDWASAITGVVRVPSWVGAKLTATITSSGSPRLLGDHIEISKTIGQNLNTQGLGSWFFIAHTGIGFQFNAGGTVVKRPRIDIIGTYRTQPTPGAGAYVPTAHNYDYVFYNCDCVVRDIVLWNASKGILIDATPATSQSRGDISGVYGCPLQIGITVNFLADVIRIDNIHFWPYLSSNVKVADYVIANAQGMQFYRCDNPMVSRYFTYALKNSIYIGNNASGSTAKLKLTNFDFDAYGDSAIFIDGTNSSASISFGVGQGQSISTARNFLEFSAGSSGCNVAIDNCDIGLSKENLIRVGGTANNVLRIGANMRMYGWNGGAAGFPAIGVTANNIVEMPVWPVFTAPYSGGLPLEASAGTIKASLDLENATYTTDGAGKFNVPTNVGRAPSYLVPVASNAGTAIHLQQTGVANQLMASTVATGAALASSAVTASVTAVFR